MKAVLLILIFLNSNNDKQTEPAPTKAVIEARWTKVPHNVQKSGTPLTEECNCECPGKCKCTPPNARPRKAIR